MGARPKLFGVVTAVIFAAAVSQTGDFGGSADAAPKTEQADCLTSNDLNKAQLGNAEAIIETGAELGVPERGHVVALATAMQESTLRNLDHGDRDSVGLFQQRDAWGPTSDRMDPATSAEMFYTGGQQGQDGLLDIDGWQSMSIAAAAQAVQVSAFPDAYAEHEPLARDLVGQANSCD